MFLLTKPSPQTISAFLATQSTQPLSYSHPRCTLLPSPPANFTADHNRILLGRGRDTFARAKTALAQWKMFDMPWVQLCWPDAPIETGVNVAVLVSHFGFWSLNPARIAYLIDDPSPIEKFGFAYGTLPQHVAIGEERFTVEYHPHDDSVWYDLYALSRPTLLARLAFPITRALQKSFARDSLSAMQRAAAG